jgi:ergothioneine biosynthesis protein EgtB
MQMEIPILNTTDLLKSFQQVRKKTENLCAPLQPEDYVVQPVVDVSPPKWHLAHTTWFFETFLLSKFQPGYKLFHPDYNYLFNSYYENAGDRVLRTDRGNLTRPTVEDLYDYRKYVDHQVEQLLNEDYNVDAEMLRVMEIGLQHEQQHQELLITDIKYILGHNPIFPTYVQENTEQAVNDGAAMDFLDVPEDVYWIGHQGRGFCFDNELGAHQVFLPAFRMMNRLVSNEEYLEFIDAGGYRDFNYWLMEGWEWVKSGNIHAPLYWHNMDGNWVNYTLYGLKPLDPRAPVTHISFFEADAYARWRGMRLPTEFEWETACRIYRRSSVSSGKAGRYRWKPPIRITRRGTSDPTRSRCRAASWA